MGLSKLDFRNWALPMPLIASVQSSERSAMESPEVLAACALASMSQGVGILRLEGLANIQHVRKVTGAKVIGLVKKAYEGSEVYITPTLQEVRDIAALGVEIIALDGTPRERPHSEKLADLIAEIHRLGCLAMADCDCAESASYACSAGADMVGTTLAGYTDRRSLTQGPDFELLRQMLALNLGIPVIAEGRFYEPWQVQAALRMGAEAVVVGGALNDPVKQTRAFVRGVSRKSGIVGAFDLGGTWMRFATVDADRKIISSKSIPIQSDREERLQWMEQQILEHEVLVVGVSTGGTVDPRTNTVIEAKPIIPNHESTCFAWEGVRVRALNDGLCTAWGHAMLPEFAGKRVATLALGTGVGMGFVDRGAIWMGPNGEYPRLNDLPAMGGRSFEDLLGGAALTAQPSAEQQRDAQVALDSALTLIQKMIHPDAIVVCGGVGLADWLQLPEGVVRSPFGANAGILGAAELAIAPPTLLPS